MKRLILFVVCILLFSAIVYAEVCEQKPTFMGRLKDGCSYNNSICEDGEMPFKSIDCKLDLESINCHGNRCIFTEIWFAKVLLIALVFMAVSYKKDYQFFMVLVILLLIINFSGFEIVSSFKKDLSDISPASKSPKMNISQEYMNDNLMMKYGGGILPSNPQIGFLIILVGLYFISRYIFNRFSR